MPKSRSAVLSRSRLRNNRSHAGQRLILEQLEDRRMLAAGDLDLTFGIGGRVMTDISSPTAGLSDRANGVAVQQDGRLVVVGSNADADFAVVRYNTEGTLDLTFSGDGKLTTNFNAGVAEAAQRVAIDMLGRLVVVGQSGTDFALARYLSDGTLDSSFGIGGKVTTDFGGNEGIVGVAIEATGKIVVGGFSQLTNQRDIALAKYNANGTLDTTFGTGGKVLTNVSTTDALLDLKLDGQGRIVGAGYSVRPGGTDFDFTLVRYNANGTLDASLDGDGIRTIDFNQSGDVARSLAIDAQGRLVLTGDAGISTIDFAVARLLPDGTLDNSFSDDGKASADFGNTTDRGYWGSAIDSQGNIVVGGYSTQGATRDDFALARFLPDGNLDTRFGINGIVTTDFGRQGPDFGLNMALQADGKIVVVGESFQSTTSNDFAVARYLSGIVDSSPGITITPTSGLITTESGGAATFTAVLNTQPTDNVTFRMISTDSTEGVVSPASVTFTPLDWNVPKTITVTGVDDLIIDGDINYQITTANAVSNDPSYNTLNPVDVTVANRDNDVPALTISFAAASISEGAGPTATTATLSRNSNTTNSLSVSLTSSDLSEVTVPASVTIPAGQTSVTFPVSAVDDSILDGNQSVTVTASATGHANGSRSLMVTDNEVAGFTVSNANTSVVWSGSGPSGTDPFGVAFASTPNQSKSSWGMPGLNNGTTLFKAPGSFEGFRVTFSGLPNGVTIAGGDSNTVLNVTPFMAADVWNETVTGNSILFTSPNPATKRLDQNDQFFVNVIFTGVYDANLLTFNVEYIGSPGLTVSETGTSRVFDVHLNVQPSSNVQINVISGDTGEVGIDKAVLTFSPANWNVPQSVTVTGIDDVIDDGDQTTLITLSIDDANSDDFFDQLLDQYIQVVTLDDDIVSPELSLTIDRESIAENAGSSAATATVSRSGSTSTALTVLLSSDDTSEATVPLTVTIPVGQSEVQFPIDAVDDAIDDGTRTVTITATAANFISGSDTVDVSDNDTAGITVSAISGNTTEAGGTASFTVVLTSEPTANVVIGVSSSDTSEGTVSTTSLVFTAANWGTPQTVTVTGADDATDDGDIAYNIVMASAVSTDVNYNGVDIPDALVTNVDNDTAGITVSAISGNTTEAGGTASFTVVLASEPTANVVIGVSSTDASEGTVSTASLVFTAANWNTPQSVTVTGMDDLFVDGDVGYNIVLGTAASADLAYNGLNPADLTVVNLDNDSPIVNPYFPIDGRLVTGGTAYTLGREPKADQFSASVLQLSDGVAQRITEGEAILTGGKKPKIGSALDYYQWSFGTVVDVTAFQLNAWRNPNSEGDNFRFEYSLNGGPWLALTTVTASTSQSNGIDLSASPLNGNLIVRVVDTDRSPAALRVTPLLDSVQVDSMYFSSLITDLRPRVDITTTDSSSAESPLDIGTFTVTREGRSGELQVFYTISGSANAGADYVALTGVATIAAGQSSTTITVTPVNDSEGEGNETVVVTLSFDDGYAYKVGVSSSASVNIADDDLNIFTASAENTVSGSILANNLNATLNADGVVETILETQSGGRPAGRTSFVDHRWTFTGVSQAKSFYLTASRPDNTEGDNFVFQYSVNAGATWTNLATVATSVLTLYPVALPSAISGTILVRAIDTDPSTAGRSNRDSVSIDRMVFSNAPLAPLMAKGTPLATPANKLTLPELDRVSQLAIGYWQQEEPQHDWPQLLSQITFEIVPIAGPYLGLAYPAEQRIQIDIDAAGFGWNRVNLFDALVHEIGHLLGHDHDEPEGSLTLQHHDVGILVWVAEQGGRNDLRRDASDVYGWPKSLSASTGLASDLRFLESLPRLRDTSLSVTQAARFSTQRETAVDEVMAGFGTPLQLDDNLLQIMHGSEPKGAKSFSKASLNR
jgi:uncharacterized delta-60 repeat protein